MKLSTRMRYGTRAMLELALRYKSGPISTKEIAECQEISPKYLEHSMATLRNAELVRSIRGAKGGHILARPPDRITLRHVFDALEGTKGFVDCTSDPQTCDRADICVTQEVWRQMHEASMSILDSITFEDLAGRAREKQSSAAAMYYI